MENAMEPVFEFDFIISAGYCKCPTGFSGAKCADKACASDCSNGKCNGKSKLKIDK